MNRNLSQFIKAARDFCQHHPKMPGYLWFAGTGFFTALGGYNGATHQVVAGVFDYISQGIAATKGGKTFAYPVASTFNILSTTAWQLPHLANGNPAAWVAYGINILSNAPVIAEPWFQKKATHALQNLREEDTRIFSKIESKIEKTAVKLFANPRPFWSVCHTGFMLPLVANDLHEGHYLMMPIYGLWISGNIALGLSRPTRPEANINPKPRMNISNDLR